MKCLVRKLGVVIENNELPFFNSRVFTFSKNISGEVLAIAIQSGYKGAIKFDGATLTDKDGTSTISSPVNIPTNENNYFLVSTTSNVGKAVITNFDKIRYFSTRWAFTWINIIEFAECLNLTTLGIAGANFRGEVRDFAEKQIEYGRRSGSINIQGQEILVDGVAATSAEVAINSETSYSIDGKTWNLVNGFWVAG